MTFKCLWGLRVDGTGLRTAQVAAASGYCAQQVRDLENLGVIPPAARAPNGYRGYAPVHLVALRAYRALAVAAGPVVARETLRTARTLPLPEAAALIGALHVELARERDGARDALRALRTIRAGAGSPDDDTDDDTDTMTITELAGALGVRTSTLRFWEQEGLVHPERVTSQRARSYPQAAIREARITAALRAAGYPVPAVRASIEALRRRRDVDETMHALHQRLDRIAERSVALLRAGADLAAVITS